MCLFFDARGKLGMRITAIQDIFLYFNNIYDLNCLLQPVTVTWVLAFPIGGIGPVKFIGA